MSLWKVLLQNYTLGHYDWRTQKIALDFNAGLNDPIQSGITLRHEMTHKFLFQFTDFGLATSEIYGFKHFYRPEYTSMFEEILKHMTTSQILTQETLATFEGINYIRDKYGRQISQKYINKLPSGNNVTSVDYRGLLDRINFMFAKSKKYRKLFTDKVAKLALNQGIRKDLPAIGKIDLASFKTYIKNPDKKPDDRLDRLLTLVARKPQVLNKDFIVIAKEAEITFDNGTDEQQAIEFLNYLVTYTTEDIEHKPEHVLSKKQTLQNFEESIKNVLITNTNLDLANSAEFLLEEDDLLNYKENIKALFLSEVDKLEQRKEIELFKRYHGKTFESSLIAFRSSYEKYLYSDTIESIQKIINSLNEATLIIKWGLFEPEGSKFMPLFPLLRKPNVVIYNAVSDLVEKFNSYNSRKTIAIKIAIPGNEFVRTVIILDDKGIVHLLNTTPTSLQDLEAKTNNKFEYVNDLSLYNKHYEHINNAFSVWMNLPWEHNTFPESLVNAQGL